jgi:hypothetical protein
MAKPALVTFAKTKLAAAVAAAAVDAELLSDELTPTAVSSIHVTATSAGMTERKTEAAFSFLSTNMFLH